MTTGFNIVETQDDIVARVKFILPNHPVLEDTLPDDTALPRDENGQLIPYVVLRFGPIRAKRREKSMMGPRHDGYFGTVDVMCVAPNGRMARLANQIAIDGLIGYKPNNGTEPLSPRSDEGDPSQFVVSSNEARPTQMVCSTRLKFGVNTRNVGVPIP